MNLLIVDAMNLIRRIYAASADNELHIEATQSRCLAAIGRNLEQMNATHVAMVFERKCTTWRHHLWPDYKLGRPPMPELLAQNLAQVQQYFQRNGIHCLDIDGWEADDVIATLASKAAFAGLKVTILSTDKGFCQLVNSRLHVRNHFDRYTWDETMVAQKFGLKPEQLVDYWALTGDSTNHLPGVAGIGPKSAGQLLDQYGDLDQILLGLQQQGQWAELAAKYQNKLSEHWPQAIMTRVLAKLRTDVPLGINLHDLRVHLQSH